MTYEEELAEAGFVLRMLIKHQRRLKVLFLFILATLALW
jgi:hypothetical protein